MKNLSSNLSEAAGHHRCSSCVRLALIAGALVASLASCTIERPLYVPAAPRSDAPQPRRPDGVAVDLEGTLPAPVSEASTGVGLVALREPVAIDGAWQVVRAFFEAVRHNDLAALRQTMTADASAAPIGTPSGPPADAQWDRRLRKFDYRNLGGAPLYVDSAVQVYRYADLDDLVGDRPSRPAIMTSADLLFRVPIATTRLGTDRVFGDEMYFIVRRVDNAFRIQAIFEDFQAP